MEKNYGNQIDKIINSVKPKPALLSSVLDQVVIDVTKDKVDRYNMREGKFINLINIMSKKVKILSGGVLVSALIVAFVFIANDEIRPEPVNPILVTETKVEVAGEEVDVDSLLAELYQIDSLFDEPVYSDEDLSVDLINSNYEIQ